MEEVLVSAGVSAIVTLGISFLTYIVSNIYKERVDRYNKLKDETIKVILFYSNILTNNMVLDAENGLEMSKVLRTLSTDWRVYYIAGKSKKVAYLKISQQLMGLSNSDYTRDYDISRVNIDYNIREIEELGKLLNLKDGFYH